MSKAVKQPQFERVAGLPPRAFFLVQTFVVISAFLLAGGFGIGRAAAAPPQVWETWVEDVSTTAATFHARLDAGGVSTGFRFEYLSAAAYVANGGGGAGFAGAGRVPVPDGSAGKGSDVGVARQVLDLEPETGYVYRVVATNVDGTIVGPARVLTTRGGNGPLALLDGRGWEMVSPVDKDGGEVQGVGGNAGGGVLQAAAQGSAVTYSSRSSFAGGQGAPVASQYVARRTTGGWATENVTPPSYGGAYGDEPDGVPYQLFAPDLSRGLLKGVAGLPLPGTGAPAGYADYYLRDGGGSFAALLTQADVGPLGLAPDRFGLSFAGASPDLGHVVLSSCAALTGDATEAPDGSGGCDAAEQNLYEWSGAGLRLVNLGPGESTGTTPARLAAPSGAVSDDGNRIYWMQGQSLYLREGGRTVAVGSLGAGGAFQTATPDGSLAFFTEGDEHLYRYSAGSEAVADLTPAGGVRGMLGAAADGSRAYFATAAGIFVAHGGAVTPVAAAPDAGNYPPATGTTRVSADGSRLLFVSRAELTPYDNTDAASGEPDAEAYLYDAETGSLACISCIPTGERPTGSAGVPGAYANGAGEGATRAYGPRALSADGRRAFFETPDSLVLQDTNHAPDVYEWEAGGTGSCAKAQGCLQLVSSGRSAGGATFVDASGDGGDVFFLTGGSLVRADPGAVDLYDAREGGGFPEPEAAIPCEEDACQPLPPPPDDPSPGSLAPSTGNPPVHFPKRKRGKKRHRKKHRARKVHHRVRSRR